MNLSIFINKLLFFLFKKMVYWLVILKVQTGSCRWIVNNVTSHSYFNKIKIVSNKYTLSEN